MANKHYTQVAEILLPWHEKDDTTNTTLYVFDVDDEKDDELFAAWKGAAWMGEEYVSEIILEDLEAQDDYNVLPGAPFHRYDAMYKHPHTVCLWDRRALNV